MIVGRRIPIVNGDATSPLIRTPMSARSVSPASIARRAEASNFRDRRMIIMTVRYAHAKRSTKQRKPTTHTIKAIVARRAIDHVIALGTEWGSCEFATGAELDVAARLAPACSAPTRSP